MFKDSPEAARLRLETALLDPFRTTPASQLILAFEQSIRDDQRERDAKLCEGWPTEAAGDEYMTCGNGRFWDAGTVYDQGRNDAAEAIRADKGEPM